MGVWWFLRDVPAARRFQRFRLGCWGCEYEYRRAVHTASRMAHSTDPAALLSCKKWLPRLDDPLTRVCYLCALNFPESMYHLYLHCPCEELVAARQDVRVRLVEFSQLSVGIAGCPPPPSFDNDVQFYTALILCSSAGIVRPVVPDLDADGDSSSVLRAHGLDQVGVLSQGRRLADDDRARRRGTVPLNVADVQVAAAWTSFLANSFRAWIMTGVRTDAAVLGQSVVTVVAAHCQTVFRVRRALLRSSVEFASRSRDPVAVAAAVVADLGGPDVGAVSSSDDDDDDVIDGLLHGLGPPLHLIG